MMAIHCTVAENLATVALLPLRNSTERTWKLITNGLFLTLLSSAKLSMRTSMLSSAVLYSLLSMCKYVHKGSDQAIFTVNEHGRRDEVTTFQLGRYICANEAAWRIFDFPIHHRYPPVQHLSVHLENGQRVYFDDSNDQERASEPQRTTLTAYCQLCQNDDFVKTLLYCEVPRYYRWETSARKWCRRIQGTPVENQPGIESSETLRRV